MHVVTGFDRGSIDVIQLDHLAAAVADLLDYAGISYQNVLDDLVDEDAPVLVVPVRFGEESSEILGTSGLYGWCGSTGTISHGIEVISYAA